MKILGLVSVLVFSLTLSCLAFAHPFAINDEIYVKLGGVVPPTPPNTIWEVTRILRIQKNTPLPSFSFTLQLQLVSTPANLDDKLNLPRVGGYVPGSLPWMDSKLMLDDEGEMYFELHFTNVVMEIDRTTREITTGQQLPPLAKGYFWEEIRREAEMIMEPESEGSSTVKYIIRRTDPRLPNKTAATFTETFPENDFDDFFSQFSCRLAMQTVGRKK